MHADWKGFFGNLCVTNWDFVCMCFKGGYYNMTSCFCCSKAWLHPVLAVVVGLALNGPKSGHQLNFIMFAILWNMSLAWRASQWPLIGEDIGFLLVLLATPLSQFRTIKWLFEMTRSPSRPSTLSHLLLLLLQRSKDTVRCVTLGTQVPGHRQ